MLSDKQKILLMSLIADGFILTRAECVDDPVDPEKPVALVFVRASFVGDWQEHNTGPVTAEFAEAVVKLARERTPGMPSEAFDQIADAVKHL